MSVTPEMTPGQMKQIIRRLDGSIPTDLSSEDAKFIESSSEFGAALKAFWFSVYNRPKNALKQYPVILDGDVMSVIDNHNIQLETTGPKSEWSEVASKISKSKVEPQALEICRIAGQYAWPAEICTKLKSLGYVTADFCELVAFAAHHGDYFARRGHAYVHVMDLTSSNKAPMAWFDDTLGRSNIKLTLDSWEEGVLNQASCGTLEILVKKA